MNRAESLTALTLLVKEIPTLSVPQPGSEAFTRWQIRAMAALIWLLGEDALAVVQFRGIVYWREGAAEPEAGAACWREGMEEATILLRKVIAQNAPFAADL